MILCHVLSKFLQYQYMNTSISSVYKCPFQNILINENHFRIWAHCNRLVRYLRQVISNTGSNIYYKINHKSIYETSFITLRLKNIKHLCSVKDLTLSVCFNPWSINKSKQSIRHKIANAKYLMYSNVRVHLIK